MATKGFVLYLLSGFSVAVLSVLFINDHPINQNTFSPHLSSLNNTFSHHPYGSESTTWPELEFSWRIVLATVIGFLGSAFGTVGGVGGGGIFVPMLTLIVGFDTKSAAALSKCMIMGASAASVWYNLRVPHPCREVPILDYDLALLFQPMLMLGITIGVALRTSSRSFFKATQMWKEETILKGTKLLIKTIMKKKWLGNKKLSLSLMVNVRHSGKSMTFEYLLLSNHKILVFSLFLLSAVLIDTQYDPLIPREEKTPLQILLFNLRWKRILVLLLVWVAFLLLQIIKACTFSIALLNDAVVCSAWYWLLFCLQFPVALGVFGNECVKLYKESKRRRISGNTESVCEATLEWTPIQLAFCALCGILGGTVGGLLGSGGGFILGPLLLEIGVIPQVASATATFVMMFSSSLSVVEFYLLKRFPIPYAIYLIAVSILAGFWGQFFIRKLIAFVRRASIIVFILSGVIFASALTMGVIGIEKTIIMIHNHEFLGFLGFCSSQ
ncbi:hypothetical protein RHGRI_007116 [Rhododendron griersonianum]|uniref:Sulfite exporter TauE/SafE family protein n=1 Tax=Rhododendron griersonianum TaxID=479676 RepID=A0AAV6KXA7_9ERIC|nr:hypothetical protein RHGRI_007116 [Rhododendron griersonianum]